MYTPLCTHNIFQKIKSIPSIAKYRLLTISLPKPKPPHPNLSSTISAPHSAPNNPLPKPDAVHHPNSMSSHWQPHGCNPSYPFLSSHSSLQFDTNAIHRPKWIVVHRPNPMPAANHYKPPTCTQHPRFTQFFNYYSEFYFTKMDAMSRGCGD